MMNLGQEPPENQPDALEPNVVDSERRNEDPPRQDSTVWDRVFALLFLAIAGVALVFSGRAVSSHGVLSVLAYPAPTPELAWSQVVDYLPVFRKPFPNPPTPQVEIFRTALGMDLLQEAVFDTFVPLSEKLAGVSKEQGKEVYVSLLIDKKSHMLNVLANGHVVKRYLVSFGLNYRAGPKRRRDDLQTPSGTYYILNKIEQDARGARLVLSYPNLIDLAEAVKAGVLTQKRFGELKEASEKKRYVPPPEMGQVSIIAGENPLRVVKDRLVFDNVSDGSVSMNRQDFGELFSLLPVGTRVTIQD